MNCGSARHAVEMRGVSKSFGGVRALDRRRLRGAEGRNPRASWRQRRRQVDHPEDPERRACSRLRARSRSTASRLPSSRPRPRAAAGIAMIFQEMSLIPTLTVAQNVFLTREAKSGFGLIDDRTAERRAAGALRHAGGLGRSEGAGRRSRGRPAAAHRDRQGDLAGRQGPGARRALDRAVCVTTSSGCSPSCAS